MLKSSNASSQPSSEARNFFKAPLCGFSHMDSFTPESEVAFSLLHEYYGESLQRWDTLISSTLNTCALSTVRQILPSILSQDSNMRYHALNKISLGISSYLSFIAFIISIFVHTSVFLFIPLFFSLLQKIASIEMKDLSQNQRTRKNIEEK